MAFSNVYFLIVHFIVKVSKMHVRLGLVDHITVSLGEA